MRLQTQENLEAPPEDLAVRLWRELQRAPHDRHHEWRTPVLATQGIDGRGPQARTVVLRHADARFGHCGSTRMRARRNVQNWQRNLWRN